MLALDKNLLEKFEELFIRKKPTNIDEQTKNFIKYLHLPVLISTHQDSKYKHPNIAKQSGNLFNITQKQNDEELIQATSLKLCLCSDNVINTDLRLNINDDDISPKFSATYQENQSRQKARMHIKALLKDANSIKIYDKFLSAKNGNFDVWTRINLTILSEIFPQKNIDIEIYCENDWDNNRKTDLENIYNDWNIIKRNWDNNIHDRYIKTDKVSILLSSGISNLADNSRKDFTYIVELNY